MGEWKRVKLGEICSRVCSGGTPRSNVAEYYEGGSIPWLNTKEVTFGRIYSTEKCITESGLVNSSAKWIEANAVVVAMYGATAGNVAITRIPLTTNQACCNLQIHPEKADADFVFYYLKWQYHELCLLANGAAQQNLNAQVIKDFEIDLPDLPTQRRIAAVLGALDDKIEVNRKICENLEAQAQALFKAWFVDFEPFGGKRPEGWKEVELPEVFYFQEGPGIRNWQYVTENGVRFINIRCIVDGDIRVDSANMISEEEAYGKYSHFLLQENDIVMSCSGTLGRYAIVRKDHLPLCLNTSVIRFRPKDSFVDFSWLYGYLGSEEFLSQQRALANGSVQANFGPTHLKNMKVMLPDAVTREKYHQAICSSIQKAQTIREENKTLAAMRDALLPKLMSGELAVEKVEG